MSADDHWTHRAEQRAHDPAESQPQDCSEDEPWTNEEVLSEILLIWEEQADRGRDIPPEKLCRDFPELAEELAEQIASLKRMRAWLGNGKQASAEEGLGSERRDLVGVEETSKPFQLHKGDEPLPGYRLIRQLGEGGFGQVWEAQSFKTSVAMKFCHGRLDVPDERDRVSLELKGLNRIKEALHPQILKILDVEVKDGTTLILVTELADASLNEFFAGMRESPHKYRAGMRESQLILRWCAIALNLLRDAAEALDYTLRG
jgi:hypothetical protein